MSTKEVLDTHRLMYRDARIRAISLSDATTPIQFVNITDDAGPDAEIGNIVYTDAMGYVFYGANQTRVTCLGVKESAIIQVDLHGNDNWHDIEWVVRKDVDDDVVRVSDVGKVLDGNNNIVWDPLAGNWVLPEYVTADQIQTGRWAEGEMTVSSSTPSQLNVDEWTHTITIQPGHASEYTLNFTTGRIGQLITIVNNSDIDVTITEVHDGGTASESITKGGAIIAVRSQTAQKWLLRSFDTDEYVAGTFGLRKQLLGANNSNTWIKEADLKENANNVMAGDDSGTKFVPPRSVAVTNNNRVLHVMNGDGIVTPITDTMMRYEGSGDWVLEQNVDKPISPAHIALVEVGSDIYPDDHPFGHHIGENKLFIRIPTVPGERIHVVLRVTNTINVGTTRTIKMYVNECLVYNQSTNQIVNTDCLVSGWLERGQDDDGAWFFWTADASYAKV